jgi:hypothetical protein
MPSRTLAAFACLLPLAAPAFDSDLHRLFSQAAAKACPTPAAADGEAFAAGARNEDAALGSLFTRMRNWHYAANAQTRETEWFLALPVPLTDAHVHVPIPFPWTARLQPVFERRIRELHEAARPDARACPAAEVHEKAGRVAHFLQDMRVPAHVIPVNHGWPFFHHDEFDADPFGNRRAVVPADLPSLDLAPRCAAIEADASALSPDRIRARLARARDDTRQRIAAPIAGSANAECRWNRVFWCDPANGPCRDADYEGFGAYPPGLRPRWGDASVQSPACGPAAITPPYRAFFEAAYADMIEDTRFMLAYAAALLARIPACSRPG